jgi:hypothetical protein
MKHYWFKTGSKLVQNSILNWFKRGGSKPTPYGGKVRF